MQFKCEACGYTAEIPPRYSGKTVSCPKCKAIGKVKVVGPAEKDSEYRLCPMCNSVISAKLEICPSCKTVVAIENHTPVPTGTREGRLQEEAERRSPKKAVSFLTTSLVIVSLGAFILLLIASQNRYGSQPGSSHPPTADTTESEGSSKSPVGHGVATARDLSEMKRAIKSALRHLENTDVGPGVVSVSVDTRGSALVVSLEGKYWRALRPKDRQVRVEGIMELALVGSGKVGIPIYVQATGIPGRVAVSSMNNEEHTMAMLLTGK